MSKLFARKLIGTLVCVAVLLACLVCFMFAPHSFASAETDSEQLSDWTVEENAATPMVDGLVQQSSAQATEYAVTEGEVDQVELDERSGVKLVSKASGTEAEGSEFYFTGTDGYFNGNFEVDFRIISGHTATGNLNYGGDAQGNTVLLDDMTAQLNPYADVVKVTFTFRDANSGKEVNLHLLSAQRGRIATVSAYVTTDTMTTFRATRNSDDNALNRTGMSVGSAMDDQYYYNCTLWRTSFSNAYSYWNTCGNDSVLPSIIGFDPVEMQIYGIARQAWQAAYVDPVKIVILDLDDPDQMGGWETQFSDTDFQGNYTVKFSIDRMTPDDTQVEYNGESIAYDRYATMMLYEINGADATAASLSDNPPVELNLRLDETETDAELYEPFTIPTPTVTVNDVADNFDGGTIAVTGPDSESVTYDEETLQFTPDQEGEYRIVYTLERLGATSTATLIVNATDTTVPQIALNSGIVNSYAWSSDLSVTFSAADVTASDASGTATVTVSAVDSANRPVTSPLNAIGRYTVTYTATDAHGLTARVSRTITISDQTAPVLSTFEFPETATVGEEISLPTVTATDDVTESVNVTLTITLNGEEISVEGSTFIPEEVGTYTFVWEASDAAGNPVSVTRELTVNEQTNATVWIIVGVVAAVVVIGVVVAVLVIKKKKKA